MGGQLQVRNRRMKVSPGGVVTLPVAARRCLGMQPGVGSRVTVAATGDTVEIRPTGEDGGFRVSPRGQLELRGDALTILSSGAERHFWLEIDDDRATVALHPFA
jgi:bifunctional DNA-binding transcriptional regulator/antitoxin component of YhaV-PrlF toxin-antitoxin module